MVVRKEAAWWKPIKIARRTPGVGFFFVVVVFFFFACCTTVCDREEEGEAAAVTSAGRVSFVVVLTELVRRPDGACSSSCER